MRIVVVNVGQGDCLLVEFSEKRWGLIDCHFTPEQVAPPVLDLLDLYSVRDLDFICLTHPDFDHFKGMMAVIEAIHSKGGTVKGFWIFGAAKVKHIHALFMRSAELAKVTENVGPGEEVITQEEVAFHKRREQEFASLLNYLARRRREDKREGKKAPPKQDPRKFFDYRRLVGPNYVSHLDGADVFCLAPTSDLIDDYEVVLEQMAANPYVPSKHVEREANCISVVLSIVLHDYAAVLGGDAGERQWESIFAALQKDTTGIPRKANFFKASHHGSRHACSEKVLSQLAGARMTVAISADCSTNSYGHPHPETLGTLSRLAGMGVVGSVFCTNQNPTCFTGVPTSSIAALSPDKRHCFDLFSVETRAVAAQNACFGTCVFEIDGDQGVRLISSDGPINACRLTGLRT